MQIRLNPLLKKLNENESVERKALEVSVNRIQEASNEQ